MNPIDHTLESLWQAVGHSHKCKAVPTGKFATIKIYGLMKFNVVQYEVENLGNLVTMTMNLGPMSMLTFALTPYIKDMPMLSIDYICAGKNRKAYIEAYDLTEDPSSPAYKEVLQKLQTAIDEFKDLENMDHSDAWYDHLLTVRAYRQGTKLQDNRFESLFSAAVDAYGKAAAILEPMTDEQKAQKQKLISEYSAQMVEKGGVSTNVFKKALGEDTTKEFYSNVFFAPDKYII